MQKVISKKTSNKAEEQTTRIMANNYYPEEVLVHILNGALNNTIKLTDEKGNIIDGQEDIKLSPDEFTTIKSKGAKVYILESDNPIILGVIENKENHTKTKTMSKQEIEAKIEAFAKTSGVSKTDLKKICLERGLEVLLEKGIQIKNPNNQQEEATA